MCTALNPAAKCHGGCHRCIGFLTCAISAESDHAESGRTLRSRQV